MLMLLIPLICNIANGQKTHIIHANDDIYNYTQCIDPINTTLTLVNQHIEIPIERKLCDNIYRNVVTFSRVIYKCSNKETCYGLRAPLCSFTNSDCSTTATIQVITGNGNISSTTFTPSDLYLKMLGLHYKKGATAKFTFERPLNSRRHRIYILHQDIENSNILNLCAIVDNSTYVKPGYLLQYSNNNLDIVFVIFNLNYNHIGEYFVYNATNDSYFYDYFEDYRIDRTYIDSGRVMYKFKVETMPEFPEMRIVGSHFVDLLKKSNSILCVRCLSLIWTILLCSLNLCIIHVLSM